MAAPGSSTFDNYPIIEQLSQIGFAIVAIVDDNAGSLPASEIYRAMRAWGIKTTEQTAYAMMRRLIRWGYLRPTKKGDRRHYELTTAGREAFRKTRSYFALFADLDAARGRIMNAQIPSR